jgi:uncharacterized repeat protein (TIGR01451 family)
MKRLHYLKFATFIVGTALIAGTMFMPWGAMATHAGPPLDITTPVVTVTTPPPPVTTVVADVPEPFVIKSAVCLPAAGDVPESVEFTLTVGNNGQVAAYNVQVRDPLPPYLELVSVTASPRGTVLPEPNTALVDIGTLNPGEIITIRVTARQIAAPPDRTGINVAILHTTSPDRNPSNNTAVSTWSWGCSTPPVIPPTGSDLTTGVDFNAASLAMLVAGAVLVVFSLVLGLFLRRRSEA